MRLAILPVLLLLAAPALAADDPIERALQACMDKPGSTTASMVGCLDVAIKKYDAQLNATYQKAMAALDGRSKELLRTAQRQWLAFRTAERAAMAGPFAADRGTMMRIEVLSAEMAAIRERAAALKLYAPDPM